MQVARRKNIVTLELKDKVFTLNIEEATELYDKLTKIIKEENKIKEQNNKKHQASLEV
jgi:hydroxymethylpyrimidine/phosphomethylpyrimidine kinase